MIMKVGIAMNFTEDVLPKSSIITEFSSKIDDYFRSKFYGSDVEKLSIGLICVNASFDAFFKPRMIKYLNGYQTRIEGGITKIYNCIEMEVKLNHLFVLENGGSILESYVLTSIEKQLPTIEKLKLKDFALDQFIFDWRSMQMEFKK